jgi:phage terminase small subunit
MPLENQKHEKFCQVWHETGNKSEAYRQSHPNSAKWKDETTHNKASELSRRGEVSARLEQLKDESVKAHGITIKTLLDELDEARKTAKEAATPQASAMVTATMSKAKLVGLDRIILDTKITIVDDGSSEW